MDSKEVHRTRSEQALLRKLESKGFQMKFDGTINVNTVVMAVSLTVSGTLAYATLDKRISIIEQFYVERVARLEVEVRDLRADIKELTKAVTARKDRD